MNKLNIKLIVGSTRANRFSEKPAQWIESLAKEREEIEVERLDLRDYPLPFFEEPLPPGFARDNYTNPEIVRWREKVREADGFISHTGVPAGELKAIHLDEEGNLLLETALGIGLLDDRDLAAFLAGCHDSNAGPACDNAFLALMNGNPASVCWQKMPIEPIITVDVPKRFNFEPLPRSACPREK